MKFHFVSNSECQIGHVKLTKFGEPIDLTQDDADHHIAGGCALLTEDEFKSLGFSDAEVKKYATGGARYNAPEEAQAKFRAAWTIASQKVQHMHSKPEAE